MLVTPLLTGNIVFFQTRDELKEALDAEMRAFDMDKVINLISYCTFLLRTSVDIIASYLHCCVLLNSLVTLL